MIRTLDTKGGQIPRLGDAEFDQVSSWGIFPKLDPPRFLLKLYKKGPEQSPRARPGQEEDSGA